VRTFRAGLPLILVATLTIVLIAVTAMARVISAQAGFLVERDSVLVVWLAGLLILAAITIWATRRVLRQPDTALSRLLLAFTAVVLASPLLLTLLQHPAR
jgi:hypothetical protein